MFATNGIAVEAEETIALRKNSRPMRLQTFATTIACLALAACVTISPGTVPSSSADSNHAQASHGTGTIANIHIENATEGAIVLHVRYWYWGQSTVEHKDRCVGGLSAFNTSIEFNEPRPNIEVVAQNRSDTCKFIPLGQANVRFHDLHFVHDEVRIEGKIVGEKHSLQLCLKQTGEKELTCHRLG